MYKPVFTDIPSDITGRWDLMKKFIEQWHEVKFVNIPLSFDEIDLGIQVSDGIKRCLHFLMEIQFTQIVTLNKKRYSLANYIFHDMQLCFGYDKEFEALLLFKNKEYPARPIYWGIDKTDLMKDDPKLVVISSSETVNTYIKRPYEDESITLTEYFIKSLFCDAGKPKTKGFTVFIRNDDVSRTIEKLELIFTSKFDIPHAIIFEKNNAIASLQSEARLNDVSILWVCLFEKDTSFMKEINEAFGQENVSWSDNCSRYKL